MPSLKSLLFFGLSSLRILTHDICSLKADVSIANGQSEPSITFPPSLYCTHESGTNTMTSHFNFRSASLIFNEDQLLEEEVHFRKEYQVFLKKRVHKGGVLNSSSIVLYNYETKPVVIGILHCSKTSPGKTNVHTDYYEPEISYCNKALLKRFYFGVDIFGYYNFFGVDRLSSDDSSPYLSLSTEMHILRTVRGEVAASRKELLSCLEGENGESLDEKTLLCLKDKGGISC